MGCTRVVMLLGQFCATSVDRRHLLMLPAQRPCIMHYGVATNSRFHRNLGQISRTRIPIATMAVGRIEKGFCVVFLLPASRPISLF